MSTTGVSVFCLLVLAVTLGGCGTPEHEQDGGALGVTRLLGGDTADAGFARASAPADFAFPRDHGAHPDYRSEWWYLTLMLRDADGREFGGQFTAFRQALAPGPLLTENPWATNHLFMAHLALTDVAGHRHHSAERFARAHPELAGVQAEPFRVWVDGWELASSGAAFAPLTLRAQSTDFGWDLRLQADSPPVPQGENGLSAKGPDQASYYYSFPRLRVSGELTLSGRRIAVQGHGWLDREWSTSVLGAAQVGWDWFALHLDSGVNLMAFRLRRNDGARDPYDQGLYHRIDAGAARVQTLRAEQFELQPLRYWRDAQGVCWPVAWRLALHASVPGEHRELEIEALLDNQVMHTSVRYWEGLVAVRANGQRIGRGYMELTGYRQGEACSP